MNQIIILFLCLVVIVFGCRQSAGETISHSADSSGIDYSLPEWAKDATICEVNIRQYTQEGTFSAFTQHLPRLKSMGVDILWFMPIYPISDKNKKGSLGSRYAVSDYKTVNPEFGTVEDFDAMVTRNTPIGHAHNPRLCT